MTILNPANDASKSVTILNSGDYSHRYADVPKEELRKDDSVTIENLLRSIDGRLQTMDGRLESMDKRLDGMDKRLDNMDKRLDKVSEDIVELKIQTAAIGTRVLGVEQGLVAVEQRLDRADDRQEKQQREVDGRLIRIEEKLERLPSWRSVGTMSATTLVSCGALFVWLAEGGAKTLAGFFD
jgi:hypothetical protein